MLTPTIYRSRLDPRHRLLAALASISVTALMALVLASGWARQLPVLVSSAIDVVSITASPPQARVEDTPKAAAPRPTAAASPANRRARPKPVVAPPTPLSRSPRPAPPMAATGNDSAAGSSTAIGPGTGAGGQGQGVGSGAGGSGDSGSRPTRRSGAIGYRDYPDEARRLRAGGIVDVRLDIDSGGRVTACRVIRSSGRADFDETTCRLIRQRFRFNPARNAAGEAVATVYGWRQRWWLDADGMPPL